VLIALSLLASNASAQPASPSAHGSAPQSSSPASPNTLNCPGHPDRSFTDVNPGDYYNAVYYMGCTHTYITGYTPDQCSAAGASWPCFLPGASLTRAQFVSFEGRAYGWQTNPPPNPNYGCSFTDVPSGFWAYAYITDGCNDGIVTGYPGGAFIPNRLVTRDNIAAFLNRTATWYGTPLEYFAPGSPSFTDVPSSYWDYQDIETMDENNIVVQNGGYYSPGAAASRADAALYIYRVIGYTSDINNVQEAPIGQVATDQNGGYWGADERRSVPVGNNSTHWATGPVGVTDFTTTFIEVGPSSNYRFIGGYGDSGHHPYEAYQDTTGYYFTAPDLSINLSLSIDNDYYVLYSPNTGRWDGWVCNNDGSGCNQEAYGINLNVSSLPYVAAAGETSSQAIHLGTSDIQHANYWPTYPSSKIPWCYNIYDIRYDVNGATVGACSNYPNYNWYIQW